MDLKSSLFFAYILNVSLCRSTAREYALKIIKKSKCRGKVCIAFIPAKYNVEVGRKKQKLSFGADVNSPKSCALVKQT